MRADFIKARGANSLVIRPDIRKQTCPLPNTREGLAKREETIYGWSLAKSWNKASQIWRVVSALRLEAAKIADGIVISRPALKDGAQLKTRAFGEFALALDLFALGDQGAPIFDLGDAVFLAAAFPECFASKNKISFLSFLSRQSPIAQRLLLALH